MKRVCFISITVLCGLFVSAQWAACLPSRVMPLQGKEAMYLTYDVYHAGKTRDLTRMDVILSALRHRQDKVRLIAWLSIGRLENPEALARIAEIKTGSAPAEKFYREIAEARIAAAAAVGRVNTPAQLARKVEVFLSRLGVSAQALNQVRAEIAARSGAPDALDTPPFRGLILDTLAEIVADAKSRRIDTSQIEGTVDFAAWGMGAWRLSLAGLPQPERIRRLIDNLLTGGTNYSRAAAQALANEGSAALPTITARLAEIAARRGEFAPEAPVVLIEALRAMSDRAIIPLLTPLTRDPDAAVQRYANGAIQSLSQGHRFVLEPDY